MTSSVSSSADLHPGQWRLAGIEVLNWGTFDGFHRVETARRGHLITGASGSGKSSLLDAITAVLTPDRLARFNAAAQDGSARGEDRTPLSYVRGAWSREADEQENRAVSRYLRPKATWSGILLRYENQRDQPVFAIRLFHIPSTGVSRSDLKDAMILLRTEISLTDLASYTAKGIQVRPLKAAFPDAIVSTNGNHGGFHARLRRILGIGSESAQHLLHKTQSAKNLGDLDHLFRSFMLDRPRTFQQATTATEQFRELNAAHEHVVDLRRQAEHLTVIEHAVHAYEREARSLQELRRLDAAREVFQNRFQRALAEAQRADLIAERASADEALTHARARSEEADRVLTDALRQEQQLGGGDLELLRRSIDDAQQAISRVRARAERTQLELRGVGIENMPGNASEFAEFQESARALLAETARAPQDYEVNQRYAETRARVSDLDVELQALKHRRSNIEPKLLLWRERLCTELGVSEKSLPFGGELLDVLEEYTDWTGALERVLRPLASTLLVSTAQLARVRRFIEPKNLGTRLVFEGIPPEPPRVPPTRADRSLVHRVRVAEGPFQQWMQARLSSDYDLSCVDTPDELDAVMRGVTIAGQVKNSDRRYEKNDRFAIDDRRRWILGSDNEAKVEFLLAQLRAARGDHDRARSALDEQQRDAELAGARRGALQRIISSTWNEFDVTSAEQVLASRERELTRATAHRPELEQAEQAVREAETVRRNCAEESETASHRLFRATDDLGRTERLISRLTDELVGTQLDESDAQDLEARYRTVQRSIDTENVVQVGQIIAKGLRSSIEEVGERQHRAQRAFGEAAAAFSQSWEAVAAALTTDVADRNGYLELLDTIRTRGLPEYEERFRRLLREKSQDLVGHLLSEIRDAPAQIRERIDPVNDSLRRSRYDADRTLFIEVRTKRSAEAQQFMNELRTIVDGSWDAEDARAEERFLAMKRVMDRLESAENGDRSDRSWRQRCLDTREHVTFLAHERDPADISRNVHESSAGLSGGQRQKLVSFCLAAALRYQLTEDDADLPTYGTIVMDEAFDKADAEYTRTVMDVFVEFGFHMILATPQKLLQTIESYIGGLTAVSNPGRDQSRLAAVPFEEIGQQEAP